jgi:hypothetical protein
MLRLTLIYLLTKRILKMNTLSGKLTLQRYDTSPNGNPRYLGSVDGVEFLTKIDSSLGYSIPNFEDKEVDVVLEMYRNKPTVKSISLKV